MFKTKKKLLVFGAVLLTVVVSILWYSYSYSSNGYGEYESAVTIPDSSATPYLEEPNWIALSPVDNKIYVSDSVGRALLVFNFDNEYLYNIGSLGTEEGQLATPQGVVVGIENEEDVIYVADSHNNKILKFDGQGNFIQEWGQEGTSTSEFDEPQDITLDSSNNLYVVDSGNHRIQKFDSSGNYISQWGSYGSDSGQFNYPKGIAVDSNNNVYVVDTNNNRIQKFNSGGNYLTQWSGDFNKAKGIFIDSEDNIYVADRNGNNVKKFDVTGQFLEVVFSGNSENDYSEDGNIHYPSDIVVNSLGDLYISDYEHRVQKFSLGTKTDYYQDMELKYEVNSKFVNPQGIFLDSENNIYVADTDNNRIQKFNSTGNFLDKWGEYGQNVGQFFQPTKMIKDSGNNIYILDGGNNRIQKFDSNWNPITQWGGLGNEAAQLNFPMDMEIHGEYVYVADTYNHRIQKFSLDGNFIWQRGEVDSSANFFEPMGLAISSSSDIYVADTKNNIIKIFSSDGDNLGTWSSAEPAIWNFNAPTDIDFSLNNNIYVANGNGQVIKFDSNKNYIEKWGSVAELSWPISIAVSSIDSNDYVYVLDGSGNRVKYFSGSGSLQFEWGEFGFSGFSDNSYLATDLNNDVFISSPNRSEILRFSSSGNFIDIVQLDTAINNPLGFVFDSSDNLYIADKDQYIKKFGPEDHGQRTFITSWGGEGSTPGKFKYSSPVNMVVDSSNNIYIMDRDNNRIQKFNSGGVYQQEWLVQAPIQMAIDSSNNIYITSKTSFDKIARIDSSGSLTSDWISGPQGSSKSSYCGVAVDSFNNIYASNLGFSYLKKFDSSGNFIENINLGFSYLHIFIDSLDRIYGIKGNNKDFDRFAFGEHLAYIFESKISGEEGASFNMPFSVSLGSFDHPEGGLMETLLVSDFSSSNIKAFFKVDNEFLSAGELGKPGTGLGEFSMPSEAILIDKYIYVADVGNHRIQKIDLSDSEDPVSWGSFGSGSGQFGGESLIGEGIYILGMTADSEGNIYVADTFNNRVQKFDGNGNYILEWVADSPFGIAIDHNSNIFTSSSFIKNNIQKFDSSGTLIKEFGELGEENGQFNMPAGLHIDLNNYLYVADAGNNRIQKFDTEGNFIDVWGEQGENLGSFNNPIDVTVDNDGNIYVADAENKRVQILYIAPQTPYNLEVSNSNSNSLTLSWLGNTYEYNVENMDNLDASDWIKNNSYTFANLVCGKNYSFRVQGKSYSGAKTDWSDILNYSIPCSSSGSNGSSPGGSSGVPLPVCDLVEYEAWEACKEGFNTQFRMIKKTEPTNCYLTVEQRQAMERSCSLNNEGENTNEGESESGNIEENNNGNIDQGYSLNIKNISLREKSLVSQVDPRLVNKLKGFLLLQTENKGELWYLNPIDSLKYYMGNPVATFNIMKMFGLGVSNKDFDLFEKNGVPDRLAGRIILKVESHGEAYYINPITMEMHYLSRPQAAFELLKKLTLGISNLSLRKIEVGLQ